ncbi:4'-phosphopantetheinyl transferase superfamily protein [Acaryochloris sp. CCMEE 5410]|uniref:4'-phosphopantetheinyl transferase family protein n=1 Tax=Acaryochloris sp. CCMEE 5410 TaxID=310037 RepID=UPI0002483896|nr:4'-phosphopantetheinyl transferase superfamily protein [Acaryochloris sp. CCMEE 5410]KAI9133819.1 4'-phosphopantetheinyl transferase superfamily protein [Acaryochloris sp. CCMEE 5410]
MSDWQWIPTHTVTPIAPQTLHIWRLPLRSEGTNHWWDLLSRDEQQRAQRFVRSQDQDKYVQVRGTLRCLLGQYLHIPGQTLCFDYGDYGKPQLISSCNSLNLQFNVSHSHELAVIAVTQTTAVGIDIEQVNPQARYIDISQRFFATAEHETLLQQPVEEQCRTFFQLWTRKEACVKAMGGSIAHALDQINVAQGLHQASIAIEMQEEPHELFLHNLFPDPNFAGAVATQAPLQHLHLWQWASISSD